MACQLTITVVTPYGLPGQPVTAVEVRGTAVECANIVVRISCGGPLLTKVAAVSQGLWQVTFDNLGSSGCLCGGGFMRVTAQCETDPACQDSRTLSPISCQPAPCPVIDHIEVEIPNCAQVQQDNGWTVTFDAVIVGSGVTSYVWSFGDQQTVSGPTLQHVTHVYKCAGTYVVTLVVTANNCEPAVATKTIELPPCGCPTIDFNAQPIADNPCRWPFSVKLGPPFAACVTTYLWNFGDDTQQTTSIPQAEHDYGHDGQYTATVTLGGGVGQPGPGGGTCYAVKNINVTNCNSGDDNNGPCPWWDPSCWGSLCGGLLAAALGLLIAASILFIIAGCTVLTLAILAGPMAAAVQALLASATFIAGLVAFGLGL